VSLKTPTASDSESESPKHIHYPRTSSVSPEKGERITVSCTPSFGSAFHNPQLCQSSDLSRYKPHSLSADIELELMKAEMNNTSSISSADPSILVQRTSHLQQDIHSSKLRLSPLRPLPDEVIRNIMYISKTSFCHYPWLVVLSFPTSEKTASSYREHIQVINGPWILSQVCKSWRRVATRSPSLWCDIFVGSMKNHSSPNSRLHSHAAFLYRIELGLQWSASGRGKHPMSVRLDTKGLYTHLHTLLSPHTDRFSEFSIRESLTEQSTISQLFPVPDTLRNIKQLSLYNCSKFPSPRY
jgi:hypothetical protein